MEIIDLHCDTIMRFCEGHHLRDMAGGHVNVEKLRRGGCMAQCFAIFVPTSGAAERHGIAETPEEYFDRAYGRYMEELELCSDQLLPARSASDVERNHAAGKMSSILTVEDCVTLDGKIDRVDDYYRRGVRMAALTWNYENSLGYPQSADSEMHMMGLKPFGIEAVERMNELGIVVDVSHLSEGGFWDVARVSRRPFAASHSCARALCGNSRNLTDSQLRALADKGGVCGINFLSRFLHDPVGDPERDDYTSVEDVIRHLRHMKNVAGADTLAIGSDYDGISSRLEWGDWSGTEYLLRGMEKIFTAEELEKVCWKNALRLFRDAAG